MTTIEPGENMLIPFQNLTLLAMIRLIKLISLHIQSSSQSEPRVLLHMKSPYSCMKDLPKARTMKARSV